MTQNPTPNPTHSHTVAKDALVRRVVAADADAAAVGAVGPLLVGVTTVVEVVADAVAVAMAVAVADAAADERAQRPVEALRQQAALGVQYAART